MQTSNSSAPGSQYEKDSKLLLSAKALSSVPGVFFFFRPATTKRYSSGPGPLHNRPVRPGRCQDCPDAVRSVRGARPCTCYGSSPSLSRTGPTHGAPPQPRESHRGIGRRVPGPQRPNQPGAAQLPTPRGRAAHPAPAPLRPGPRAPHSRSFAPLRAGAGAQPDREHAARTLASSAPARGERPAGPRAASGRVRAWRRAAAGPEQAASPAGLPLPWAAGPAGRPSPCYPAPGDRDGAIPLALLTEDCERREPRSKGRTAAKPETDTAAILGPELCDGGRGRSSGTARGGRGRRSGTARRAGALAAAWRGCAVQEPGGGAVFESGLERRADGAGWAAWKRRLGGRAPRPTAGGLSARWGTRPPGVVREGHGRTIVL